MALLGLDIGTTGSRAVLVDGDGHLLATATHEVRALSNAVPLRSDGSSAYGG